MKAGKFFELPAVPVMHTLAARHEAETREFAVRWGWQHWTTDWKSALADPEVDLVDVVTPNNVHAEHAIAALEAGKHVACEKPLADNLEHAAEMVQAAAQARGQTFVWYNYRRCPAVALAYQLCQQGRLGRIYQIRGCYLQDWAGPDTPLIWRFQGDVAGSGSLGDLCADTIDTARFITGDEVSEIVGATLETVIKERRDPTGRRRRDLGTRRSHQRPERTQHGRRHCAVHRPHGKRRPATFEATRLSTGYKNANRIEIHGEKGAIRFNFERMNELDWYDATLPEHVQGWSTINVTNGNCGHPYAAAWWPVAHVLGYEHSFVNQAADMMRAIAGQSPVVPLPDFADSYKVQRVLAAVMASNEHRTPVHVSEIGQR